MISREAVLQQISGVSSGELEYWVASGWVRPESTAEGWAFAMVDVARIRLISEIRHELQVGEEAIPLVLSLLDQLYALRQDMNFLCRAIAEQPKQVRSAIASALSKLDQEPASGK